MVLCLFAFVVLGRSQLCLFVSLLVCVHVSLFGKFDCFCGSVVWVFACVCLLLCEMSSLLVCSPFGWYRCSIARLLACLRVCLGVFFVRLLLSLFVNVC